MVFYFYTVKIKSTNIAEPRSIQWRGREIITGIYKYPVTSPIFLGTEIVKEDTIADRKVHGGPDKACYLFSSDHYDYWQNLYPQLEWDWGMFGENLTVDGLDESALLIGDIYKVGTALVQVSQPREPCFKLGIRFGTQNILKEFIEHGWPGTYVRILKEGKVCQGDRVELVKSSSNALSIRDFFKLTFNKDKDQDILKLALTNEALPLHKREKLKKYIKKGGS